MSTLRQLVMDPRYRDLRAASDWATIAADLNAPAVSSAPNPQTEPGLAFRTDVEPTLATIAATVTPAEYVTLADDDLKINSLATTIGTPEAAAAVQGLGIWMLQRGKRNASVYDVAEEIMGARDVEKMQTLIGLVISAGHLSAESAGAISAALLAPDPDWSDTVYTFGPSTAATNELGNVTPADVLNAYRLE